MEYCMLMDESPELADPMDDRRAGSRKGSRASRADEGPPLGPEDMLLVDQGVQLRQLGKDRNKRDKHDDAARATERKSKGGKPHSSPFTISNTGRRGLARENALRTPATHQSSPLKPSRPEAPFDTDVEVLPPPASEGRRRSLPSASHSGQDRRRARNSSPTVANRISHGEQSDISLAEQRKAAQPRSSLPRSSLSGQKRNMTRLADDVRRPDSHPTPGSSRHSSIPIEVSDSENEEKQAILKASTDTAQKAGETQTSRPGPSRQVQRPPEANGHRHGDVPGQWPNPPRQHSHSHSEEEGVDDIVQFSRDDESSRYPKSKGKAKEAEQENVPPLHRSSRSHHPPRRTERDSDHDSDGFGRSIRPPSKTTVQSSTTPAGPSRPRRQMQDKDGCVQSPEHAPLTRQQSKASKSSSIIPSSKLGSKVQVASCYAVDLNNQLPFTTARIERSDLVLEGQSEGRSERLRIGVESVLEIKLLDDDTPTFALELELTQSEFKTLQSQVRTNLESPELPLLVVLKEMKDRTFFPQWLASHNAAFKFKPDPQTLDAYVAHGPYSKTYSASKPRLESPRDRALRAAEERRNQAASTRGRTAPKAATKGQGRQTTLQMSAATGRRSSRIAQSSTPRYNESSPDVLPGVSYSMRVKPPADKNRLLFNTHSLDITVWERFRFATPSEFLNDTCLEFGLCHTLDHTTPKRDDVHCFNSFFYSILSEKGPKKDSDEHWHAYETVKRWTRKVDIFSKKFIFVPVNENYHWYLAVIYNPAGILQKARAAKATPPAAAAEIDDLESISSSTSGCAEGAAPQGVTGLSAEAGEEGDPLNIIDQDDEPQAAEDAAVKDVRARVDGLELEAPQPIASHTLDVVQAQWNSTEASTPVSTTPPPATHSSPVKKHGRKPYREDFDILGSDETWIFTLDSLGNRHPSVAKHLKDWLTYEARDKRGEEVDFSGAKYFDAKCLNQPNFSDCGLYLIHFVQQILERSDDILRFIGRAPRGVGIEGHDEWEAQKAEVWAANKTGDLRGQWVAIIDVETSEYRGKLEGAATGGVGSENVPPESQASVQAISQPAPEVADRATTPPAQTLDAGPSNGRPVPFSTPLPTSTRPRARVSISASPATTPEPRQALSSDHKHDTRLSSDQQEIVARLHDQQRSRSRVELSDDEISEGDDSEEEEEHIEARSFDENLQASHEREETPPPPQGDELEDDDFLFRPPIINPALQIPTSAPAMPSASLEPPQQAKDDQSVQVPGTYPDVELDEDMEMDAYDTVQEAPSTPVKASPMAQPSAAISASPEDPFVDLGTAGPHHRSSEGGGRSRAAARLSAAHYLPTSDEAYDVAGRLPRRPPPGVLVPASSPLTLPPASPSSNGRPASHSNADARASPANSEGAEQPSQLTTSDHAHAMEVPDADTTLDHRPESTRGQRRRRPSDSAVSPEPEAKRSRPTTGSPQASAPSSLASSGSPPRQVSPPTTRAAARREQEVQGNYILSDSDDEEAKDVSESPKNGRHALPATPPSPMPKGKGRATRAAARQCGSASGRKSQSPPLVQDSDADADADEADAPGPATKQGRSRQEDESWTPTIPTSKRPTTYARSGNKRRKTDTQAARKGQPTLHDHWAERSRESRGGSAKSPIAVNDDSD